MFHFQLQNQNLKVWKSGKLVDVVYGCSLWVAPNDLDQLHVIVNNRPPIILYKYYKQNSWLDWEGDTIDI